MIERNMKQVNFGALLKIMSERADIVSRKEKT
jgi:hypothetical protein